MTAFLLGGEGAVFSYSDLVRTEIALEVSERFGVDIAEQDASGWQTLGDVCKSVVSLTGGLVLMEDVFCWLRSLITDCYGVTAELTLDEAVFNNYDRMTGWFLA